MPALSQENVTPKSEAFHLGHQALRMMDAGDFQGSIELLERAHELQPDDIAYTYGIGYAYYQMEDFGNAIKYLEPLLKHKDAEDRVYQLLGNSYGFMGNNKRSLEIYDEGLIKFPASGRLFLEKGKYEVLYLKDYEKALDNWEEGIIAEPSFAENYYFASKLYYFTEEKLWAVLYGELYLNFKTEEELEAEISRLVYDTFNEAVSFNSSNAIVAFSKKAGLSIIETPESKTYDFENAYENTVLESLQGIKGEFSIKALYEIREKFLELWFAGSGEKFPNLIFEYHRKLRDAGHFEAYNFNLFKEGNIEEYNEWVEENRDKLEAFMIWYEDNPLILDDNNYLNRYDYR